MRSERNDDVVYIKKTGIYINSIGQETLQLRFYTMVVARFNEYKKYFFLKITYVLFHRDDHLINKI